MQLERVVVLYKTALIPAEHCLTFGDPRNRGIIVCRIMSAPLFAALVFTLTAVLDEVHAVQYGELMENGSEGNGIPVGRISMNISLTGNISSNSLSGPKGEKGERGKAGPPGRPASEYTYNFNCSQRLNDLEERLATLTLLVENIQSRTKTNQNYHLRNCQEAKERGYTMSGVYTVDLHDGSDPFPVYCDLATADGGWTVFQRRQDGSVDFNRLWADYKTGFGDLNWEFWLGLEKLHRLTNAPCAQVLRIDLEDFDGNKRYAEYSGFVVGNETGEYVMTFEEYSGNAGDSLSYHNKAKFSTADNDNDLGEGPFCPKHWGSAWWYVACHYAHLNGVYSTNQNTPYVGGLVWHHWKGWLPLKFVEMKLRSLD